MLTITWLQMRRFLHPWQFVSPAITDDRSYFALAQAPCCCNAAVVYDMNGREAKDVEPVLAAVGDVEQYIFCSSAGVYLKSDQMPHREEDSTDPKSRHKVSTHESSRQQANLNNVYTTRRVECSCCQLKSCH